MAEKIWQGLPSHAAIHRDLLIAYSNVVHNYNRNKSIDEFNRLSKVHVRLDHATHPVWNVEFKIEKEAH
jgi:hypothetical protein